MPAIPPCALFCLLMEVSAHNRLWQLLLPMWRAARHSRARDCPCLACQPWNAISVPSWFTGICVQKFALRLFCPRFCRAHNPCRVRCNMFLGWQFTDCFFRIVCQIMLPCLLLWKQPAHYTGRAWARSLTGPCVLCSGLQMLPCSRIFTQGRAQTLTVRSTLRFFILFRCGLLATGTNATARMQRSSWRNVLLPARGARCGSMPAMPVPNNCVQPCWRAVERLLASGAVLLLLAHCQLR